MKIINIQQGLEIKAREIVEMVNTLNYEFINYLNKAPPIESIQIIIFFKIKYEELIEILKKSTIKKIDEELIEILKKSTIKKLVSKPS